ncbi:class I SAM-dependent RNA methyltransferase [Tersicoccus phoenicis]|uniref:class I SAM-dependent RNA methyltransferase n=1 Tax=Tersicoccus phoenicis TaxID=554083 RepID=UPI000A0785CE|nr:TRAM domain-containing protein [Tersicoccus phoenicis]
MNELELALGPIAHGGHTVARHEGRVVFVRHGIPGERVRVRVTEAGPTASFWRADVVAVLEASGDRRPHPWPEADALAAADAGTVPVGGAEFGHIAPARQRRLKREVLAEQVHRLAGLDAPDLPEPAVEAVPDEDPAGLHWRTRVTFDVTADGRVGMHPHRSDAVLPVATMPLAVPAVDALGLARVDLTGVARVEVAVPSGPDGRGGRPLLTLFPATSELDDGDGAVTFGPVERGGTARAGVDRAGVDEAGVDHAALRRIAAAVPGASVCWLGPVTHRVHALRGEPWVTERVGERRYRVTGDGFWQVHRRAPDVLAAAVRDALGPVDGLTVHDLYAGAGLFSGLLAAAGAAVTSVEAARGASADAALNLADLPAVTVRHGDVARYLGGPPAGGRGRPGGNRRTRGPRQGRAGGGQRRGDDRRPDALAIPGPADVVVVDPPRVGLDRRVTDRLIAVPPARLAYVSCDPASFARDLGRFRTAGWQVHTVRAFDLYPNTHHLESFALLTPPRR